LQPYKQSDVITDFFPSAAVSREQSRLTDPGGALTLFHKETIMRKVMALLMLLTYGLLTGCNTMEGLGKDVERGGEKIKNEARENR
jgi:predicted small secreted protein